MATYVSKQYPDLLVDAVEVPEYKEEVKDIQLVQEHIDGSEFDYAFNFAEEKIGTGHVSVNNNLNQLVVFIDGTEYSIPPGFFVIYDRQTRRVHYADADTFKEKFELIK